MQQAWRSRCLEKRIQSYAKLWVCELRNRPKGTERSGEHVGLSSVPIPTVPAAKLRLSELEQGTDIAAWVNHHAGGRSHRVVGKQAVVWRCSR